MSTKKDFLLRQSVKPGLWFAIVFSVALAGFLGCSPNDPFDPNTLENEKPICRFFATPLAQDGELTSTSYFDRTFFWSASDIDGWVEEYYISIRLQADVPAPWDTTTQTDTTMTFATDENGDAEAIILLACRDNRGALSDTLSQMVPLRNFPPAINFQSDFEFIYNLQREIQFEGETPVDTLYWNFGASNFRLFVMDLDGQETMDSFYRYTLSDTEPTVTWDSSDPGADPEIGWVKVPFATQDEIKKFELFLSGVQPGNRTLTISVSDEAEADTRFTIPWIVRDPSGPIIYIPDNSTAGTKEMVTDLLDYTYGNDQWESFSFWHGLPDHAFVTLETFRSFNAVVWTDGGTTSPFLEYCTSRDGVLQQYLDPVDTEIEPGGLLLITSALTGSNTDINNIFLNSVLGITPSTSPVYTLDIPEGKIAEPQLSGLLPMTCASSGSVDALGLGLVTNGGAEIMYRMEECVGCYTVRPRPPHDPVIAIRRPARSTGEAARIVGFSAELEHFDRDEVTAALQNILIVEMEVNGR